MQDESPVVLIVDDDREVADAYAGLLSDGYEIRVAYGGIEAIDRYDADVDIVLLDRRMPHMSGGAVLERIRAMDGECRVAMVTAVDPDFDIIEIGFDDYVVKPVDRDELEAVVGKLLKRSMYDNEVQAYFSLVTKRARLEAEKSTAELERSPEYERLTREIEEMKSDLDDVVGELTMEDFALTLRDIQSE